MTFADGSTYVGEYVEDNEHGEGVFTEASTGNVYTGQWRNGVREGHGVMKYTNGDVFEGSFEDDQKHGPGKYVPHKGVSLEGVWANDVHQPDMQTDDVMKPSLVQLIQESTPSDTILDQPQSSARESPRTAAVLVEPEPGDSYEGDLVDGKKEGHGKLISQDGTVYVGNFVNDMKHGSGVLVYSSGVKYEGTFR
jgi:hypothetical protein